MYDERITNLINAALADGALTEKEKQILFKNAEAQGIDLDEFEMVLDAKLVELKKQEAALTKQQELELEKAKAEARANYAAPKSDKFGDVRKCPNCGTIIGALQATCPECGFEIAGVKGNSSAQKLLDMLREADSHYEQIVVHSSSTSRSWRKGDYKSEESEDVEDNSDEIRKQKITIIKNFPVPNTKEDLLEFIMTLTSHFTPGGLNVDDMARAYKTKFEECVRKAEIMFPNDETFIKIMTDYKNRETATREKRKKGLKIGAIAAVVVGIVVTIIVLCNL